MSISLRLKKNINIPKLLAKLKEVNSSDFIQKVQETVVEGQIKRLIASGQSPVDGFGRFVQYKDREKYPDKKKPASPVNLSLTGSMLKFYTVRRKNQSTIAFGFSSSASSAVLARAHGNNEGTLGLAGKKLNKEARKRIKDSNLSLIRQTRGGSKRRSIQQIAKKTSGVPARRIVPLKGETFTISVIRSLKNLYVKRIKSLLSKNSSRT